MPFLKFFETETSKMRDEPGFSALQNTRKKILNYTFF
jgi:hypothetical protein